MRVPNTPHGQRRFAAAVPTGHGIVLPAFHPALRAGRSLFPSRVFAPDEVQRLLKDGHQSRKIGKIITKGRRRGWPIYTLTLEERATCPRGCREWASCYGNNMQAAERIDQGDAMFPVLEAELERLAAEFPTGFLVRLHVLGDFWSVRYVEFWAYMLHRFKALYLFGFTAHDPGSPIGEAIGLLMGHVGWERAAFRYSGLSGKRHGSAVVLGPGEADPDAILCPAQTGATDCCATCALCWQSTRSIAFRRH